jgi:hypothetical protein
MRKFWLVLSVLVFFFFFFATSNGRKFVQINAVDGEFVFSAMFFSHELISGRTEIIFYNIPEYFRKYTERDSPRLYDDYFNVEQFTFHDEGFNNDNGFLSYKLLLVAKISLLQNENLTALLSKILQREISVGYMEPGEMTKNAIRPWAISFDFDKNMYFANSNAVALYQNDNLSKVLYVFDLNQNKIEFTIGYQNK